MSDRPRNAPGIGHNGGPDMGRGKTWRTHQWRKAQRDLMPNTIPLMVVRMRMRRAAELGMTYRAYAQVRQSSGQDILALLFSSNALRIIGAGARMPADRAAHLAPLAAPRLSLVHPPNTPGAVALMNPELDAAATAPRFTESWSAMRTRLETFLSAQNLPGSRVLIVGDAPLEADWSTAARAAAYLPADSYFPAASG